MNGHEGLAARFEAHRDHLRVAYRMLGALDEADDAVQLAWLRADRADVGGIENLAGWLTTVVARVCLDMLRTRRTRGEVPLSAVMADTVTERRDGTEPECQPPSLRVRNGRRRNPPTDRVELNIVASQSHWPVARTIRVRRLIARQLARLGLFGLSYIARPYCDGAVLVLREVAQYCTLQPTVRWRTAHAMVQFRRDTRDEAVLITRELLRSVDAPCHVKWRAARGAARSWDSGRTPRERAPIGLLPRPRRGEVRLSAPYRPPTTSRDAALATISLRGR